MDNAQTLDHLADMIEDIDRIISEIVLLSSTLEPADMPAAATSIMDRHLDLSINGFRACASRFHQIVLQVRELVEPTEVMDEDLIRQIIA